MTDQIRRDSSLKKSGKQLATVKEKRESYSTGNEYGSSKNQSEHAPEDDLFNQTGETINISEMIIARDDQYLRKSLPRNSNQLAQNPVQHLEQESEIAGSS